MSGRKRSHCFSITINHVEWSKKCFGEYMLADEGLVKRLAVGQEKHHPEFDCDTGAIIGDSDSFHHHIFIEFVDNYFLTEVRDLIVCFLGGEDHSFDIQVSR